MPEDQEEIMNRTPLTAGCMMHPFIPTLALQIHLMEGAVRTQQQFVVAVLSMWWSPFRK